MTISRIATSCGVTMFPVLNHQSEYWNPISFLQMVSGKTWLSLLWLKFSVTGRLVTNTLNGKWIHLSNGWTKEDQAERFFTVVTITHGTSPLWRLWKVWIHFIHEFFLLYNQVNWSPTVTLLCLAFMVFAPMPILVTTVLFITTDFKLSLMLSKANSRDGLTVSGKSVFQRIVCKNDI